MNETLYFDNTAYISASSAAEYFGVTRDYITKLCRLGKISARRVEKNWYVAEHAFKEYLLVHLYQKSARREALTRDRLREYHEGTAQSERQVAAISPKKSLSATSQGIIETHQKMAKAVASQGTDFAAQVSPYLNIPAGIAQAAIQSAHEPLYTLAPALEILHRISALFLALLFVFGLTALAHPTYTYSKISLIEDGATHLFDADSADLLIASFSPSSSINLGAVAAAPLATLVHVSNSNAFIATRNSFTVLSKKLTSYGTALVTDSLATGTASTTLGGSVAVTITPMTNGMDPNKNHTSLLKTDTLCVGEVCVSQEQFLAMVKLTDQPTSTSQSTSPHNTFRPIMVGTSSTPVR